METNSNSKKEAGTDKQEVFTYKQGQYPPRKRKDITPKINPQLAVELVYAELKNVEAYTKRMEEAAEKIVSSLSSQDSKAGEKLREKLLLALCFLLALCCLVSVLCCILVAQTH